MHCVICILVCTGRCGGMYCSNRDYCPPSWDNEATKRICGGAGSCQCDTQTMMQVQIQQSHRVAPAPSPPEQLRKLCLHFSKPGVKNLSESCSKSHTAALSYTTAIWHWKSNLGRQIWRFKRRWHGCCLNPQIMGHVGLSYSCMNNICYLQWTRQT